MTREEAIEILWQYDVNFEPHPAEKVMHAIDMAIEALQREDEFLKSLESNEPKFYDEDDYWNGRVPTHGRLIDADALSKKLCETTIFIKDGEVFQRMINDAPTVQADRPHGVWEYTEITTDNDTYSEWVCSECGGSGHELMWFCPWCRADMRKEKE